MNLLASYLEIDDAVVDVRALHLDANHRVCLPFERRADFRGSPFRSCVGVNHQDFIAGTNTGERRRATLVRFSKVDTAFGEFGDVRADTAVFTGSDSHKIVAVFRRDKFRVRVEFVEHISDSRSYVLLGVYGVDVRARQFLV